VVVVSLMAGSATGVPMSPAHGGYQTATPLYYCPETTCATTGYYTTKSPDNYTTAATPKPRSIILLPRAALSKSLNTTPRLPSTIRYYSAPSYYTDSPTKFTTNVVEYYTEALKYDRNQSIEDLRHPT
jgi:hypothetical protein